MAIKRLLDSLRMKLRRRPVQKAVRDCTWQIRDAVHQAANLLLSSPARPRIAVVSMWNENQASLAAITTPGKIAYCRRHGYDWLPRTSGFSPDRPVAWSKLLFIRDALADYDWVFWSDVDSMVMNPSLPLEGLLLTSADLVITEDYNGINSGSFLLRRCEWSRRFLDSLWSHPETPEFKKDYDIWIDRLWENRAFWHLLKRHEHRRHTLVVAQRKLNSYLGRVYPEESDSGYQPGDFILHLPGMPDSRRIQTLIAAASAVRESSRVF